ncbi:hypothetical protein CCY99_03195 [Helicobacter sp. 16-1353]|uniref:major outer membrane protein n=1 Tax=Helicobacter sp. 16-1353 TaxID=2004996 RepID=UPI000DCEEDBE|nr:major outer membrane protein [Helicobacter sp. 16-1353]RAX54376.1 hypothetical protein CCY99_03195 [Helicobacter sp. 16-1353]
MKKISLVTALALAASSLSAAPIEELIKGASIDGSAFFRYISNSGRNAGGQGFVSRVVADLNSGSIEGFSFNLGLFYHYGGTPTQGSKSDGNVGGSRATRDLFTTGGNAFGVSTLYGKYAFEASKTSIVAGKLKLATPITSAATDRGLGVQVTNSDVSGLTMAAAFFDSWAADHEYISGVMSVRGTTNPEVDTRGSSFGNNLSAVAFIGNYDPVTFQVWYFNADKLLNSVFGEIAIGSTYQFKAQIAYTDMYNSPTLKLGYGGNYSGATRLAGPFFDGGANGASARGLYTLQFSAKPIQEFGVRVGFVGSFANGYGVSVNNEGAFSKGGKYWFDNWGDGRSGFSAFGDGGFDNTHINVWYLALTSKVSIVDIGLDIAGISGKNHYTVDADKAPNGDKITSTNHGNRTFYEVTPSIDINITKQAKVTAYYAVVFGQINAQRFWTQMSYKF